MYHKTSIIFVKTIISVQFQGQIDKSADLNVTNSDSNNKIANVAQGGDDGDGPSSPSQQPTMKLTPLINTMV
jgi:hypothetical protein